MMKKVSVLKKVEVSVSIEKLVPATVGFFWGFYKDQYKPHHVVGSSQLGYYVDTGALKIPVEDIDWYGPVEVPDFPEESERLYTRQDIEKGLEAGMWHPQSIVIK